MRLIITIALILCLQACGTGIFKQGQGPSQFSDLRGDIRARAEACQASELDLLPQSAKAISLERTDAIIQILQSIYKDPQMPAHMQAESLYQIALIHMNEYNRERSDQLAKTTLLRLKNEFPNSALCHRADHHLAIISKRQEK